MKQLTNDFFLGLRTTFRAFNFVFEHKMAHFFIYPLIITVIIGIAGLKGVSATVEFVETWFYNFFDITKLEKPEDGFWSNVVYWLQNIAELLVTLILYIISYFIVHKTIKYVVLILMSPIMALLSEKTEVALTGKDFPFHWGQFLKDIWRGILIAMRNFFLETFMVLAVLIAGLLISSFLPIIAWLVAPLTWLLSAAISSYYWGFATMDYTNERRRLSMSESVQFIRDYKGVAVGNGLLFYLMISVPVLGAYLGPVFATVLCTVGATLAIHEKVDLNNEDIVLHKSTPTLEKGQGLLDD